MPFIQKHDGSYLMESLDIIRWLEETYPDRPSLFVPEADPPVDRTSVEYKKRADLDKEDFKKFSGMVMAVWAAGFPVCESNLSRGCSETSAPLLTCRCLHDSWARDVQEIRCRHADLLDFRREDGTGQVAEDHQHEQG